MIVQVCHENMMMEDKMMLKNNLFPGPSFIATAAYKDVGYQDVDLMSYVNASSREEFVAGVFQGLGNGQVWVQL